MCTGSKDNTCRIWKTDELKQTALDIAASQQSAAAAQQLTPKKPASAAAAVGATPSGKREYDTSVNAIASNPPSKHSTPVKSTPNSAAFGAAPNTSAAAAAATKLYHQQQTSSAAAAGANHKTNSQPAPKYSAAAGAGSVDPLQSMAGLSSSLDDMNRLLLAKSSAAAGSGGGGALGPHPAVTRLYQPATSTHAASGIAAPSYGYGGAAAASGGGAAQQSYNFANGGGGGGGGGLDDAGDFEPSDEDNDARDGF